MQRQIKSKDRVKKFAEVYTNEREVKGMCNLIPTDTWDDITTTFLEPSCGNGNFLVEILERKLKRSKDEKEGLKALNSIFGIDILEDNVAESKVRMLEVYKAHFPQASNFTLSLALAILNNRIIADDFLDPQTEIVKSWGITGDKEYIKRKNKRSKELAKKSGEEIDE